MGGGVGGAGMPAAVPTINSDGKYIAQMKKKIKQKISGIGQTCSSCCPTDPQALQVNIKRNFFSSENLMEVFILIFLASLLGKLVLQMGRRASGTASLNGGWQQFKVKKHLYASGGRLCTILADYGLQITDHLTLFYTPHG
jgi:hypothetical protein